MEEEAFIREQQMAVQHRLDTHSTSNNKYEGEFNKKILTHFIFIIYILLIHNRFLFTGCFYAFQIWK